MRGFLGLVALALAHVARSEVIVSNFAELQNATAEGAVIRITSSFDWTGELVIGSGVNVTITNDEGVEQPILDRRSGGDFFDVEAGGTLVVRGLTFKNGRVCEGSSCSDDVCMYERTRSRRPSHSTPLASPPPGASTVSLRGCRMYVACAGARRRAIAPPRSRDVARLI